MPPRLPVLLNGLFPKLLCGLHGHARASALAAMALALVLGLLLLPPRMAKNRLLVRCPIGAYIELMRNTPLLLQIYLIYFGLPLLGFFPSEFACGVVGIALQHAAFLVEIYRGGIESISQRQWEAARAIGMRRLAAFRYVILPQTVLRVLGPLGNQLIILVKDTSLVSAIGVMELTMVGKVAIERSAVSIEIFARHRRLLSAADAAAGWRPAVRRAAHGGEVLAHAQHPDRQSALSAKGAVVTLWLSLIVVTLGTLLGRARRLCRANVGGSVRAGAGHDLHLRAPRHSRPRRHAARLLRVPGSRLSRQRLRRGWRRANHLRQRIRRGDRTQRRSTRCRRDRLQQPGASACAASASCARSCCRRPPASPFRPFSTTR